MLTEQEKHIPQTILDKEYMTEFFNKHGKDIDGRIDKVAKMDIYPIKKHIDDVYFHLVNLYAITFFLKDGSRKRFKIFSSAFSGNKREKMFNVLKLAYDNGFKNGKILVPRPLWYINELEVLFYVGVPGDNLLEHIKNGAKVKEVIKKAGKFLANFHPLKPQEFQLQNCEFNWLHFDPTGILKLDKNVNHKFTKQILDYYKILESYFKKLDSTTFEISHGDFHPENIIINHFDTSQIVIIDFSETCLAPLAFDLGSFLQQLRYMSLAYDVSGEKYKAWQKIFLHTYFTERKIELTPEITNQINLFQARTALKSAIYYMVYKNQYEHVEALLKIVDEIISKLK